MRRPERFIAIFVLLALIFSAAYTFADPSGAQITQATTTNATAASAGSIVTYGGSFTTMLLNATTQTMKWKAYVGNVTGGLALQNAQSFTIYDWKQAQWSGEIFASRNSTVNWPGIKCINSTLLATEESQLNITTTLVDSINSTFNNTIHKAFYVGTSLIQNSTCRAIATYVNNTKQAATESASFQEILLQDNQVVVYTTLIENKAQGYNNNPFDFQMIVPESPVSTTPTPYYFWAELR